MTAPKVDMADEIRRANRADAAFDVLVCIAVSPFGRPAGHHMTGARGVLGTDAPSAADWQAAARWAREHWSPDYRR